MNDDHEIPSPSARCAPATAWRLVLVHGTAELLGRRFEIGPGLTLGRSITSLSAYFSEDRRLSREHARFRVHDGAPRVRDLGSRNGTTVNDVAITAEVVLHERDVVQVGKHVFVVCKEDCDERAAGEAKVGNDRDSCLSQRLADETRDALTTNEPLLLVGETGTGKAYFARAFHARSGRTGPFTSISLARVSLGGLRARLLGERGAPGLFASAEDGTLLIERWDRGEPETRAYLLELLRTKSYEGVDGARRPLLTRILVSVDAAEGETRDFASAKEGAALRAACAMSLLAFPPLRERPEDAVLLAGYSLAALDEGAELADALVMRIVREHWSANIDELHHRIERSYLEEAERENRPIVLTTFCDDDEPPAPSTPAPRGTRVGRSGAWFLTAQDGRVELAEKPELAAILGMLAREAAGSRKHRDWRALFEAAWPGELKETRAGASRVFVAISALRKLGLDRAIVRHVDGYSLDASIDICD